MNTANWIPDLLMKRVATNADWTLFSPDDVPDLHDLYGDHFETAYIAYEAKAAAGNIKNVKKISAVTLWRKMLTLLFETGHPWITFKDPCNIRSPQQHIGVVHSSNLCTEITLNTSQEEIAVCNLGSINVIAHMTEKGLDQEKLKRTIRTALRMLDNVIDINYYSVPQAKNSNMKHRPIGLGIMGFQDALYTLRLPYASQATVDFADRAMELISYYAIEASTHLAEERGAYSSFAGSLWSQGILPIDSLQLLKKTRGEYLEIDTSQTLDWDSLRERVMKIGMRNSNVLAIAPTATISNICGVSQSIEPTYQNLFVKSNLSGEFTVINAYLVADLKKYGLWDEVMVNDLKYYNGSVANITRIPTELKNIYATAFEIDPLWLVEAGARRQKWIDQSQSLNLYMAQASGKKLDQLYKLAWLRGLKTTYYLRSLGATNTEKATIEDRSLNAVSIATVSKVCLITDPDCEACQ
jgi:ribonucleoside-diphosphate reductase alpha chain